MTLDGMQFCRVPAGPFTMGSEDRDDEKPPHRVELREAYFIGRFPVTVAQWREYLQFSGNEPDDADSLEGDANLPVSNVTWRDAQRFCTFVSRRWAAWLPAGWRVTLPSEAEWEKAARGGHELPAGAAQAFSLPQVRDAALRHGGPGRRNAMRARRWPWGDEFDPQRANTAESSVGQCSAVGACAAGASPYGCQDMAGNVWEWTRSLWGKEWDKPEYGYPYHSNDARENEAAPNEVMRLLRGGSFINLSDLARCAFRDRFRPGNRYLIIGFRVVLRSAPVL
jgi:iron(II)-dependent oxidoreductase